MKLLINLLVFMSISLGVKAQSLLIYGGDRHREFLGCLNCSPEDKSSIWNVNGPYGNPKNENSIWNENGYYGGTEGHYSPFNPYTSAAPILVDKNGNIYGNFTANTMLVDRVQLKTLELIFKNRKEIVKNISAWYPKIFKE